MHNIKLLIAYDGREFLGWQKTQMGPSIEETLQLVLEQILQHPTPLQAASRTDAGVHATGQVVNFFTSKSMDLQRFQKSANSLLPKSLVIRAIEEMPFSFHPTLDCIEKEYRYFICYGKTQLPSHRFYSWHVPYPLDFSLIEQASSLLRGRHDFSAFCNTKKNAHYSDFTREVTKLEKIDLETDRFYFCIRGNHFLYKMVRNLVGTLVDVGKGKLQVDCIHEILESHTRSKGGITAPAHGLFLYEIFY